MIQPYVIYKKLQPGNEKDFHDLVLLINNVFTTENSVNKVNIKRLLNDPGFECIVAIYQEEVIGGITAYELLSYDQAESMMYLYDLAVQTTHQRIGIGSRLVAELLADCRKRGINELFVQTEEADVHAVQ